MKGFLFFTGSLLQWPPKKPRQFLLFHGYIIVIYGLTSLASQGEGLIFTVGMCAPLFLAIYRGLPLDCLDYKSAISREFSLDQ